MLPKERHHNILGARKGSHRWSPPVLSVGHSQLCPAAIWQPANKSRSNSTDSAHVVQGTCPFTDHSTSPNPSNSAAGTCQITQSIYTTATVVHVLARSHTSPSPSNSTAWMITEVAASCTHTRSTTTAHANIFHGAVQVRCTCAAA